MKTKEKSDRGGFFNSIDRTVQLIITFLRDSRAKPSAKDFKYT